MFVLPERSSATNTNEENGLVLRHYLTNTCESCAIKRRCTTAKERRITRWEHEHVLEAVQKRLDKNPQAMRQRRETMLRKYFLDISQDEQRRRFEARVDNPLKHWKLSPMDIESVRRWTTQRPTNV